MVCVYNVTGEWRHVSLDLFRGAGLRQPVDAIGGHAVYAGADGQVALSPYAAWWVVEAPLTRSLIKVVR